MTVYKVLEETLTGSLVSVPYAWPGETSFAHKDEFGCLRFNAPQKGFAQTDLAAARRLARVYIGARPGIGRVVVPSLWRAESGGTYPVKTYLAGPTLSLLISQRVYEVLTRIGDPSADPDDPFFGNQYPVVYPGGFSLKFKTGYCH